MTQIFRTEADVMVAAANHVDNTNNDVQGELTRLRGIVDGLSGSWTGEAQTSFGNLMERWNISARDLREALTSIADNIRNNAKNFEGMEAENSTAFTQIQNQGLAL